MNDINFKCSIEGKYKIQILQGGVIVSERPWANNMILNQGKNWVMAGTRSFQASFIYCAVGTGTTPVAATDTGLTSEAAAVRTATYLPGTGNCGTSWVGQVGTMRRTFDFAIETSNQNYSELGWSWTATKSTNLFSKTLISGGTVTVLADQQLRVVYDVSITCAPVGVQTSTLTIGGWGTPAGTWALQALMFAAVSDTGAGAGAGLFEPSGSVSASVRSGTCTLAAFNQSPTVGSSLGSVVGVWDTYTLGTFTRSITFPYFSAISFASTDIRMFLYGTGQSLAFRFDSPQTKLNTYRLRPNGYSVAIT